MGILSDNEERERRRNQLTQQCLIYIGEVKQAQQQCEDLSKKLFIALEEIAKAQGKNLESPFEGDFTNCVFESGSYYKGIESLGNTMSFFEWTINFSHAIALTSGVTWAGANMALAYSGRFLVTTTLGAEEVAGLWNNITKLRYFTTIGREMATVEGEAAAPLTQAVKIAKGAKSVARVSAYLILITSAIDLIMMPIQKSNLVDAIHLLCKARLNTYAHKLMVESVIDNLRNLTSEAEYKKKDIQKFGPERAKEFDIKEHLKDFYESISKELKQSSSKAQEQLKVIDSQDEHYTKDDLVVDINSTDINNLEQEMISKLIIRNGYVVDSFAIYTIHNKKEVGIEFGGTGGREETIKFEKDEYITQAKWRTGSFRSSKVIFNLCITTNKRDKLGPFGSGREVISDKSEQYCIIPPKMRACGMMDASAKLEDKGGYTVLQRTEYIQDLRFVIAPVIDSK